MLFDEDAILLSFFNKYDADEEEDLQTEVIAYAKKHSQAPEGDEGNTTGETIEDMSSPQDSHIGMKKRMAALK